MNSRHSTMVFSAAAFVAILCTGRTAYCNEPPVANAGLPRYAATDPVTLDGTGSYDPDNSGPLTYAWRQTSSPPLAITGADTATPTISGFVQTDAIQECVLELMVSDGELTNQRDTTSVIVVPTFGDNTMRLENASFDPDKPTFIYFGGGISCDLGYSGQRANGHPDWKNRENIVDFPDGYEPDRGAHTFYHYADMIIVYLSSVAPEYAPPIQICGFSAGGQPAIDVALRLNLTYRDARYGVNHATLVDATGGCRDYSESIKSFLASSVDGEQCWIDTYTTVGMFHPSVLNIASSLAHGDVPGWYGNSLMGSDMSQFNNGVVAGAYWSVFGPGKNLQLASTPGAETYHNRGHSRHLVPRCGCDDSTLHSWRRRTCRN